MSSAHVENIRQSQTGLGGLGIFEGLGGKAIQQIFHDVSPVCRTTWPQVKWCRSVGGTPGNSCCLKDATGARVPEASTTA